MEIKSIKNKTGTVERAIRVSKIKKEKKKKELDKNIDKSKTSILCFLSKTELGSVHRLGSGEDEETSAKASTTPVPPDKPGIAHTHSVMLMSVM